MKFDEVISMLKLSKGTIAQLQNLQMQNIGLPEAPIEKIKVFATEFLQLVDIKNVNEKSNQKRSVCTKDKRIDLHVQNIDGNLQIDRKDFYRGQEDPFIKVGINICPGRINFASSFFKADSKEEFCYIVSFDSKNNVQSAEIIENGQKSFLNQEQSSQIV